jgi:hypothetical protein
MLTQYLLMSEVRRLLEQQYLESAQASARDRYLKSSVNERRATLMAFVAERGRGAAWATMIHRLLEIDR